MQHWYRTRIRPGTGTFQHDLDIDASFCDGRASAGWVLWRDGLYLIHGTSRLSGVRGSAQAEIAALEVAVGAVLDDVRGRPLRLWNDLMTAGSWMKKLHRKKKRRGIGRTARRISLLCGQVEARVELWAFSRRGLCEAHRLAQSVDGGSDYAPPQVPRCPPSERVDRLVGRDPEPWYAGIAGSLAGAPRSARLRNRGRGSR